LTLERKPALLTNATFAALAPFFVTFEVLNFFGYMKSKMVLIQVEIDREIKEFKRSGKTE